MDKNIRIQGIVLSTNQIPWISKEGWEPTQEDIDIAEPIIVDFIKIKNKKIFSNLGRYKCQYFGIFKDNKKRIYCNFFYFTEDIKDWKSKPIEVDDGGDCYFQLEYDVENKECLNFRVNGKA